MDKPSEKSQSKEKKGTNGNLEKPQQKNKTKKYPKNDSDELHKEDDELVQENEDNDGENTTESQLDEPNEEADNALSSLNNQTNNEDENVENPQEDEEQNKEQQNEEEEQQQEQEEEIPEDDHRDKRRKVDTNNSSRNFKSNNNQDNQQRRQEQQTNQRKRDNSDLYFDTIVEKAQEVKKLSKIRNDPKKMVEYAKQKIDKEAQELASLLESQKDVINFWADKYDGYENVPKEKQKRIEFGLSTKENMAKEPLVLEAYAGLLSKTGVSRQSRADDVYRTIKGSGYTQPYSPSYNFGGPANQNRNNQYNSGDSLYDKVMKRNQQNSISNIYTGGYNRSITENPAYANNNVNANRNLVNDYFTSKNERYSNNNNHFDEPMNDNGMDVDNNNNNYEEDQVNRGRFVSSGRSSGNERRNGRENNEQQRQRESRNSVVKSNRNTSSSNKINHQLTNNGVGISHKSKKRQYYD